MPSRWMPICLDLHGAMVAEHLPDGEGELLARIRKIHPDLPIACALDLHGNITAQMFEHSDIMVGFRTYPHVDMAETGYRAAKALDDMLRAGGRWAKAMRTVDYLIPILAIYRHGAGARPLPDDFDLPPGVATASMFMGFPAADFAGCGPATFAYGPDAAAVRACADAMAAALLAHEAEFVGTPGCPRMPCDRRWRWPNMPRVRSSSPIRRTIPARAGPRTPPACCGRWSPVARRARRWATSTTPRPRAPPCRGPWCGNRGGAGRALGDCGRQPLRHPRPRRRAVGWQGPRHRPLFRRHAYRPGALGRA